MGGYSEGATLEANLKEYWKKLSIRQRRLGQSPYHPSSLHLHEVHEACLPLEVLPFSHLNRCSSTAWLSLKEQKVSS